MLDAALKDTERLGELIQNFLTLSKLETGKAYCNIEAINLNYALDLALNHLQTTSQVPTIPNIQLKLPHQLPSVLVDVDGLVEVFIKLLDNACKFTPADGDIIITAQLYNVADSSQMLEVIVADTGRGVDVSELEVIFNRFSQSESYLRRTVNGVGLGLVICRQIIQGMGGEIWATSAGKNQGSQFHFTIPIDG